MVCINKDNIESDLIQRIDHYKLDYDSVLNMLVILLNKSKDDKKYTKHRCVNHLSLTLFGLRKPKLENYIKVPIINIFPSKDLLSDMMFVVRKYRFVKKEKYAYYVNKEFKESIIKAILIFEEINNSLYKKHDFTYSINILKTYLNNNVFLEETKI